MQLLQRFGFKISRVRSLSNCALLARLKLPYQYALYAYMQYPFVWGLSMPYRHSCSVSKLHSFWENKSIWEMCFMGKRLISWYIVDVNCSIQNLKLNHTSTEQDSNALLYREKQTSRDCSQTLWWCLSFCWDFSTLNFEHLELAFKLGYRSAQFTSLGTPKYALYQVYFSSILWFVQELHNHECL